MDNKKVEIVFLVDRSLCMQSARTTVVSTLSKIYYVQAMAPGSANISLYTYAREIHTVTARNNALRVRGLGIKNYALRDEEPALPDALAEVIDTTGRNLADTPEAERPRAVYICILCGTGTVASCRESFESVAARVRLQQDVYKWNFLFCAPEGVVSDFAGKLGFAENHVAAWDPKRRASCGRALRAMSSLIHADRVVNTGTKHPPKVDLILRSSLAELMETGFQTYVAMNFKLS